MWAEQLEMVNWNLTRQQGEEAIEEQPGREVPDCITLIPNILADFHFLLCQSCVKTLFSGLPSFQRLLKIQTFLMFNNFPSFCFWVLALIRDLQIESSAGFSLLCLIFMQFQIPVLSHCQTPWRSGGWWWSRGHRWGRGGRGQRRKGPRTGANISSLLFTTIYKRNILAMTKPE